MMDNNTNIEIIEDKTLELEFIVHGESHGVCNALRHILMQDSDVEYAKKFIIDNLKKQIEELKDKISQGKY